MILLFCSTIPRPVKSFTTITSRNTIQSNWQQQKRSNTSTLQLKQWMLPLLSSSFSTIKTGIGTSDNNGKDITDTVISSTRKKTNTNLLSSAVMISNNENGDDDTKQNKYEKKVVHPLASSRYGLDPSINRFHAPIVYHEKYSFRDWPPNHTFPMDKFNRIANALTTTTSKSVAGSKLPRPLVRSYDDFFRPLDMIDVPIKEWIESIMITNDNNYVYRFINGQLTKEEARMIGFREQTHRPELIERTILEVAGTVLTAQLAYRYGIACNVAGGTHHAGPLGGAGYTIINDLAVTANFVTDEQLNFNTVKGIHNVLVIDCDVHQGDGTAKFSTLWDQQQKQQQHEQKKHIDNTNNSNLHSSSNQYEHNDNDNYHNNKKLTTLSFHCESNYPRLKANSTYDIGLHDGCTDEEYMKELQHYVMLAIKKSKPDFVLYDAGVDVYEHDKLGRLSITEDGIRHRDRFVLDTCVTLNIPVVAVVGGGYDKDINALARRHAIVHEECAYVWRKHKMWKKAIPISTLNSMKQQ